MTRGFATVWHVAGRGRRGFRRWRRSRPFWGGLLLMLAGGALWLSANLDFTQLEISFGPQGFLAVLLPVLLLLSGLLSWITPQYRHFYSIIGLLTAVYSLLGLNLGGLFLGMLLGIVGGSLVFAWTPVKPAEPSAVTAEDEHADAPAETDTADTADTADPAGVAPLVAEQPPVPPQMTGPLTDETPGGDQVAPVQSPRKPPRTFVVALLPLVLVSAVTAPLVTAAQDGGCQESATVGQTSSPSPSPGPTASPEPCEPEPTPTTEPPATTAPPPGEEPSTSPPPAESSPPATEPAPGDGEGATPSPSPSLTPPPEVPVPPEFPRVSTDPSLITAERLDVEGFVFEGIAELPTAEGTITTLKFLCDSADATDAEVVSNRRHQPQTTVADSLRFSGGVEFYASRFSGRVLGVPITLDPEAPGFLEQLLRLIDLPPDLSFTDVELELAFTIGGHLQAIGFDQSDPAT